MLVPSELESSPSEHRSEWFHTELCSPLTTTQHGLASPGLEKVSESALWVDKPAFPQPSNSYQGKFSLKKKKKYSPFIANFHGFL